MDTEAIDKLFLELSQFTKAKTKREVELERRLSDYQRFASYCRSCALSGESDPQSFEDFIRFK